MSTYFKDIQIRNIIATIMLPAVGVWLSFDTPFVTGTRIWALVYYFVSGIGITAGYHRLWSHRSFNAGFTLQTYLAIAGAACFQGSIYNWCKDHREHHRYVDTERDPYSMTKGFWHAHMGWLFLKPKVWPDHPDISDLQRQTVVRWQHENYPAIAIGAGLVFPAVISGLFWNDWKGGYVYAGLLRIFFFQQSTFCVNSLAHWLGTQPYDDKHSPRDHLVTALVTFGEGYHNFHHEFPSDYRNGIKWYHYDPSKWCIWTWNKLRLANQLKTTPSNLVRKGEYRQQQKLLDRRYSDLQWGPPASNLLPMNLEEVRLSVHDGRQLIAIDGFLFDITDFADQHPGGKGVVNAYIGKDATNAFTGGVYLHSNAARNLLDDFQIGRLVESGEEKENLSTLAI